MKKFLWLLVVLSLCAYATEFLPGNYFIPDAFPKAGNPDEHMVLRGRHVLVLCPDTRGNLYLELGCQQIGKYTNVLRYTLISAQGKHVGGGVLQPGEQTILRMKGLPYGAYRLELDAGANAANVRHPNGKCALCVSNMSPLKAINYCPLFFFMTYEDDMLELEVSGDPPAEHVLVVICDSTGKEVFRGTTVGKEKHRLAIRVPIPEKERRKVWSIRMGKDPAAAFEDMTFTIKDGAEPVVALSPDQLVFPLFSPIQKTVEEGRNFVGMRLSRCLAWDDPAWNFESEFRYQTSDALVPGAPVMDGTQSVLRRSAGEGVLLGAYCDREKFTYGTLNLDVSYNGESICRNAVPIATCEGVCFEELPWVEKGALAEPTAADQERGFQVYQREEPGFVRPSARPHRNEVTDQLQAETSPGLFTTEFFGVYYLGVPQGGPSLELGALTGPDGAVIPSENVELFACPAWPQCTDWNATTYIIAPELMLEPGLVHPRQNESMLFAVRVKVPEGAVPGVYQAALTLDGRPCLTYKLTVDDFHLPEVPGYTFGLYADGDRWAPGGFTDEEILEELRDYRDHGMNALMLYPFTKCDISYDGKDFHVDLSHFRHEMELYNQVGFNGVAVISLQVINAYLMRALHVDSAKHTPEFVAGFHAVLNEIKRIAEEDHWPEYCLHTVDEPDESKGAEEAVKTIRLVKQAGFKTFNTCYGDFVRKHLAPWLDYRCYNNIGFMSSPTREANEALRQETLSDGDVFWWYGTGCYTNFNLQQDCNIYTNRHMLGIFNWRSRVSGAWTWTFMRQKGASIYNDFDAQGSFEAKEACICYPTPGRHRLIHTLQWEALREGVYDYRYLYLWDLLCQKAQGTEKAARAAQSRRVVQVAMDGIAWTCKDFQVGNGQLRALRALLIREIRALK